MQFDYSKLRGRIREEGLTQEEFAKKIGISPTSLSHRLTGKLEFSQNEIIKTMDVLSINKDVMDEYFFKLKV